MARRDRNRRYYGSLSQDYNLKLIESSAFQQAGWLTGLDSCGLDI
jgi:hypothetical protein